MIEISHDAFARCSLVRKIVRATLPKNHPIECSWCGQRKIKLFQYGTERDDRPGESNVNWHTGEFCSKGCHDSYHS